jgi:hypothetical protein
LINHALQSFAAEGAIPPVKDHRDSPTIRILIDLVRTVSAVKAEAVTDQCGDKFAGAEVPK